MDYASLFRMPTPIKITSRSSSITNAFINSIIPVIPPSVEEIKEALDILGMTPETYQCAYCGDKASEWDHLRPLVIKKRPTGYISEINNLVPSCGKCNQSKGNKYWKTWMASDAKQSPTTRPGVEDVKIRISRLEQYEKWREPTKINFEEIMGNEWWSQHWQNCDKVQSLLKESEELAAKIRSKVKEAHTTR